MEQLDLFGLLAPEGTASEPLDDFTVDSEEFGFAGPSGILRASIQRGLTGERRWLGGFRIRANVHQPAHEIAVGRPLIRPSTHSESANALREGAIRVWLILNEVLRASAHKPPRAWAHPRLTAALREWPDEVQQAVAWAKDLAAIEPAEMLCSAKGQAANEHGAFTTRSLRDEIDGETFRMPGSTHERGVQISLLETRAGRWLWSLDLRHDTGSRSNRLTALTPFHSYGTRDDAVRNAALAVMDFEHVMLDGTKVSSLTRAEQKSSQAIARWAAHLLRQFGWYVAVPPLHEAEDAADEEEPEEEIEVDLDDLEA